VTPVLEGCSHFFIQAVDFVMKNNFNAFRNLHFITTGRLGLCCFHGADCKSMQRSTSHCLQQKETNTDASLQNEK
jgi:hypothetical protein